MKKRNFDIFIVIFIIVASLFVKLNYDTVKVESFTLIFLSVLLEAMPFILIGSIVSSIISVYVTTDMINKIIPKNKYLGIFLMSIVGFVFPLCECSIVPITKGLMEKKLPKSMAIAFMLSVPVVNPIVFVSTYIAFQNLYMPVMRLVIGVISGFIIGSLVEIFTKNDEIVIKDVISCSCGHDHHHHHDQIAENSCNHHHHPDGKDCNNSPVIEVIQHSVGEFFNMGKYLIFGAFVSALIQSFFPSRTLLAYGQSRISSVLIMMLLAFILSVCSEADAFVAKSFTNLFTNGSILSFLTYGPMVDIKNTFMIFGNFGKKFAIKLITIITAYHIILGVILNLLGV